MKRAIHPNKMTLDHSVLREVVSYLYQKEQPLLPKDAFAHKLTLWYYADERGQDTIEVTCEHTQASYRYQPKGSFAGEFMSLKRFNDHILRNAMHAMYWRRGLLPVSKRVH